MTDDPRRRSLTLSFNMDAAIDQAFSRLIDEPWGRLVSNWTPSLDLFENDDAYLVVLELPGVPAEAITLHIDGDDCIISGERHTLNVHRSERAVRLERTMGRFSRRIRLPHPVDLDRADVRAEHGLVTVQLPKTSSVTGPV